MSELPNEIDGVSYKSSLKGWMPVRMFSDYFSNQYVLNPFAETGQENSGSIRVLHYDTSELLQSLQRCRTEMNRLPPNFTSLAQNLYQMVLRALKSEWKRR